MPIYEYQCPQCQAVFEEWVSVSEASNTAICPQCGTLAGHIISNTAFVLKGGGWYVTDYGNRRHESPAAPAASSSESAAVPASSEAVPAAEAAPATSAVSSSSHPTA